ncbi:MAG: type II and III secretion system protein family protein [Magnetospirillum sp.]|nr:type II and III secretion system protein family protein [Magnetospirillum sp.]
MGTPARRLIIAMVAALASIATAMAQNPPTSLTVPTAGGKAAAPPRELNLRTADVPVGEPLGVAVNKSTELHLPAAARDVIVGNPDIADVVIRSPTELYVVGRAPGQTNIIFRDDAGRTIGRAEVDVHVDSEALADTLRQLMPDETAVKVSAIGDSIFLTGTARSDNAVATARAVARRFVKDDANIVNLLRVANEQQVLLHVKVAEMKKTALKELGFSDSMMTPHGVPAPLGGNLNVGPNSFATGNNVLGGAIGTMPSTTTSALALTSINPYGALNITGIGPLASTFTMLEQQGLVKTLVEPNLTAVSGETASMLAGGEFPIPVSAVNGSLSIEFKQFGIGLNFTPVVVDSGRISLKLQTEVSAIDKTISIPVGQGVTVPGLTVRRASSVVEMPSGGAVMIAGLLQNDITQALAGLPGLMDVPVLGTLFRSSSFQHNESELVVIVSSYVVQPVNAPQMSLPTDGFAPSSDFDRYVLGRLQATYIHSRELPATPAQLQGPIGYIVH